jgi:hypothetical protein
LDVLPFRKKFTGNNVQYLKINVEIIRIKKESGKVRSRRRQKAPFITT